ncbi:hydroxymethylbilane synthase [Sulfobacillus harzensis]|uniref:Porphobilinogen deaminase n=1 Tax=Sulfobacillus harzensis TaxID=2729629 RepID=A0A7Y0Q535_9FIRM|nr:hydroxymethylbilane synthase [Sulfobacillus harzensis]NMP23854.1 hydroxymethylbilane synthase [Sulfobacillus harzensis]
MADYKIGTRSSQLAVAQTQAAAQLIEALGHRVELVTMETKGDRVLDRALHQVGGKGLFTEELERALLNDTIDLAVHSLKDLPTQLAPGLEIGAYVLPEDRRDVVLAGMPLSEWRPGMAAGTSSLRRAAFLRHFWPEIEVKPIRGNLQTRAAKWHQGQVDGLVLAAAGVIRMGWENQITQYLDPLVMVPSPGQGILAIEAAHHRTDLRELLAAINDVRSERIAIMERAVLDELGGGCQVPLGAFAEWVDVDRLRLTAHVASVDGGVLLRETVESSSREAESVGRAVGRKLREQGALALIQTQEG